MNSATDWQLWNQLQATLLTQRLGTAAHLVREINRVIDHCSDHLECREWASMRRMLRPIAPAIAAAQLLEALRKEEEWRAREEAGELDPDWDYETMVGQYRRAAIAAATLPDPEHQQAVPA